MKRKQFVISTIIALLLALFAGCKQSFSPTLQKADQVLSTDTEKGSKMLDSICQAEPNMSTADKKYYQLLKLKASDKDYQPITNQKLLIDSLVSYFEHAGEDNLLAEAYFYAGRVYYEIGDKPEALKFYQKASEKVAKDNYALQGDIYCQMANVYRYTDLNKEALAAQRLAYQADSLSGNIRNMLYDIRDMGETYNSSNNLVYAKSYMQKGIILAKKQQDTLMTKCFHHGLACICIRTGNWNDALAHVKSYIRNMADIPDKTGMLVTAIKVYSHFKKQPLADSCKKVLYKEGNIFGKQFAIENELLSQAHSSNNQNLNSLIHAYKYHTDSIIKENNANATKKAEQLYNYELKEKENEYLHSYNAVQSVVLAMTIMIAFLAILYFYMKKKNIQQKGKILQLKLDKYENLKAKAEIKPEAERSHEYKSIIESEIFKIIMTEIDKDHYRLSEKHWDELQQIVNRTYPNFDKNLYSFLEVSPQEYRICLLVKIGISPTNIAHFMNVTKEAITASRRRMYTKSFNKKGKPSDWDKIILSF